AYRQACLGANLPLDIVPRLRRSRVAISVPEAMNSELASLAMRIAGAPWKFLGILRATFNDPPKLGSYSNAKFRIQKEHSNVPTRNVNPRRDTLCIRDGPRRRAHALSCGAARCAGRRA